MDFSTIFSVDWPDKGWAVARNSDQRRRAPGVAA
jgi:hypothetical protein